MATQYQLTWVKRGDGGRWRKRYRGQWLSYPGIGGKVASYQNALDAFRVDKMRIDTQLATDNPLLIWIEQQQADILATYCDSKELRFAWEVLEESKAAALALSDGEQKDSGPFSVVASLKKGLRKKVFSVLDGTTKVIDIGKPYFDVSNMPPIAIEDLLDIQSRIAKDKAAKGEHYEKQSIEELQATLKPVSALKIKEPRKPTGVTPWEQQTATVKPTTLGELANAYIADRKKMMEVKKGTGKKGLSVGRFDNERCQVNCFVAYADANLPLNGISSQVLNGYWHHVQSEKSIKTGKPLASATRNERLRGVKDVLRWAVAMDFIDDEPKFIRRGYSVKQVAKAIKLPSKDDVLLMFNAAPDKVKLYILLALNCGMLQQDMSDLVHSEVTIGKTSIIRRKRSKTSDGENVPIVTYRLWRRTAKLLKQEMATDGELVLLNADGGPLVSDELKPNGKRKKVDCVDSEWGKLRRKTRKRVIFKMVRKFAASVLASHLDYGRYAQYFLGHAPENTADKHYIVPSDAQFAQALTWLESAIFDA